jgi:hypothetical protein
MGSEKLTIPYYVHAACRRRGIIGLFLCPSLYTMLKKDRGNHMNLGEMGTKKILRSTKHENQYIS